MKKLFIKRAMSGIVACLVIFFLNVVSYASDDVLTMKLELGKSIAYIDDEAVSVNPPFMGVNDVYIPLRAVLDAFGAEVIWKGDGKINIIYNSININMSIGELEYIVNQQNKLLKEEPQLLNGITMIPLEIIKDNFDVTAAFYRSSGKITIILKSDGSLKDLSFLTNSIVKKTAGNSYFGWSIDIPKGSRILTSSFNSKLVKIINQQRRIVIEIKVWCDNDISLQELYDNVNDDPETYLGAKLIDSSVSDKQDAQYVEFLYNSIDNQAVLHRVYKSSKYLYDVMLVSLEETDPYVLKNSMYYRNIMNTFSLGYKGDLQNVQDLSKIDYGFVKYDNYLTLLSGNKYFLWQMDVLPEWDSLNSSMLNNALKTKIGLNNEEYLIVEVDKLDEAITIEEFGEKEKLFNKQNLNVKNYEFISDEILDISGNKVYKLVYWIKLGKNTYRCEDNYILSGNLVYNISIKSTNKAYIRQKGNYDKMIASFKPANNEIAKLEKDIANYKYEQSLNMLGKEGKYIEYKNKDYAWKTKFPGTWIKSMENSSNAELFVDPELGMSVFIEVVENNSVTNAMNDIDKFSVMRDIVSQNEFYSGNINQIAFENVKWKDLDVLVYTYRLEDDVEEDYGTLKFYIINRENYSYCFFTMIPDIVATDKNIKIINDIWEWFEVE